VASVGTRAPQEVSALNPRCRVLRYHTRGHGESAAGRDDDHFAPLAAAAHLSNWEQPEAFNRALSGFLDAL